jgi:creatinine amidohydrolase
MLALAPQLVDMSRAEPSPALGFEAPGPLTPSDVNSPNYSRSGSYGDPTLATSAKGDILLAALLDDLREQAAAFIAEADAANRRSGLVRSVSR